MCDHFKKCPVFFSSSVTLDVSFFVSSHFLSHSVFYQCLAKSVAMYMTRISLGASIPYYCVHFVKSIIRCRFQESFMNLCFENTKIPKPCASIGQTCFGSCFKKERKKLISFVKLLRKKKKMRFEKQIRN